MDASCVSPVSDIPAPVAEDERIPPFIPDDSTYKVLNSLPATTLDTDDHANAMKGSGSTEILTLEELKKILDNNGKIDQEKYNLTPLAQDHLDSIRSN